MDETGILNFWYDLSDRGFGQKSRSYKGEKKSKQRITVAFFVSTSGHKKKPVVIWKSKILSDDRGDTKSSNSGQSICGNKSSQ